MLNLWAVLAAAIANMLIGALWYSHFLFGEQWLAYIEMNKIKLNRIRKQGMALSYATMLIGAWIMSYALAYFLKVAAATTAAQGLAIAFTLWLGFVAVSHLNSVLFEKKPPGYYWLTTLYYLVVLLAGSVILTLWK